MKLMPQGDFDKVYQLMEVSFSSDEHRTYEEEKELLCMFSKKICLEVELPEEKLAARRIEFYRRNGFSLNEFPYMQPSITQGRKSIPLRIMTSGGVVTEKEFNDIVGLLYAEVYQTSVPEKF